MYVPLIAEMDDAESIRYEADVLNGLRVSVCVYNMYVRTYYCIGCCFRKKGNDIQNGIDWVIYKIYRSVNRQSI